MENKSPIIVWMRRDFRLHDNPALKAAQDSGRPIIPLLNHKEVIKTTRYFEGTQSNQIFDSTMVIDSVYFDVLGYSLYDTSFVYDLSLIHI